MQKLKHLYFFQPIKLLNLTNNFDGADHNDSKQCSKISDNEQYCRNLLRTIVENAKIVEQHVPDRSEVEESGVPIDVHFNSSYCKKERSLGPKDEIIGRDKSNENLVNPMQVAKEEISTITDSLCSSLIELAVVVAKTSTILENKLAAQTLKHQTKESPDIQTNVASNVETNRLESLLNQIVHDSNALDSSALGHISVQTNKIEPIEPAKLSRIPILQCQSLKIIYDKFAVNPIPLTNLEHAKPFIGDSALKSELKRSHERQESFNIGSFIKELCRRNNCKDNLVNMKKLNEPNRNSTDEPKDKAIGSDEASSRLAEEINTSNSPEKSFPIGISNEYVTADHANIPATSSDLISFRTPTQSLSAVKFSQKVNDSARTHQTDENIQVNYYNTEAGDYGQSENVTPVSSAEDFSQIVEATEIKLDQQLINLLDPSGGDLMGYNDIDLISENLFYPTHDCIDENVTPPAMYNVYSLEVEDQNMSVVSQVDGKTFNNQDTPRIIEASTRNESSGMPTIVQVGNISRDLRKPVNDPASVDETIQQLNFPALNEQSDTLPESIGVIETSTKTDGSSRRSSGTSYQKMGAIKNMDSYTKTNQAHFQNLEAMTYTGLSKFAMKNFSAISPQNYAGMSVDKFDGIGNNAPSRMSSLDFILQNWTRTSVPDKDSTGNKLGALKNIEIYTDLNNISAVNSSDHNGNSAALHKIQSVFVGNMRARVEAAVQTGNSLESLRVNIFDCNQKYSHITLGDFEAAVQTGKSLEASGIFDHNSNPSIVDTGNTEDHFLVKREEENVATSFKFANNTNSGTDHRLLKPFLENNPDIPESSCKNIVGLDTLRNTEDNISIESYSTKSKFGNNKAALNFDSISESSIDAQNLLILSPDKSWETLHESIANISQENLAISTLKNVNLVKILGSFCPRTFFEPCDHESVETLDGIDFDKVVFMTTPGSNTEFEEPANAISRIQVHIIPEKHKDPCFSGAINTDESVEVLQNHEGVRNQRYNGVPAMMRLIIIPLNRIWQFLQKMVSVLLSKF